MRNLFITSILILFNFFNINAQVLKENTPKWVNKIDFETSGMDKDDIDEGSIILLYDNQINASKKVVYNRLTTKITNNAGVQNASSINIAYDPTYQSLKLHKIEIIRDGEVLNKLDIKNFQVIRRELNAESFLYDGSLSAIMNISDVRTGDIIDYSYSVYGFNPLHKKFSSSFYLNDVNPIAKINISILSKNALQYKSFNTKIEPTITKKGSLNKYNWITTHTKKVDYEENTPSWKLVYESVFVSEYKSWKEVVDWGLDLYNISNKTDEKLDKKIKEIDSKYKSQGAKIKAVLNFVQNDIRYLGLESGIGGYKPFTPSTVFERRFGDCKDKSFLMITMLNKMDIEAYPMIVNTYLKQTIKGQLPSPKFFDHCVVKVIKDKSNYYYDPTISNQGGDYDSTHFPNYGFGLVIKKDNDDFDEIKPYSENRVETIEEYTLDTIGKGATLKVVTTYYESEADNMRNFFKNNSINSVKKEYENFYSNYYYNVSSLKTPYSEFKKYLQDVKKVDQTTGYYLFCPTDYSSSKILDNTFLTGTTIKSFFTLILIGAAIVLIILVIFLYSSNKRKT